MPHIVITKEQLITGAILVTLYVLGAAVALTKLLDTFQSLGWIKEGTADEPGTTGAWNQRLSLIITLASFILVHLGAGAGVDTVIQAGVEAAAVLVASGILAVLAYLAHQIVLILEGMKPKSTTPSSTVTVKTEGGVSATATATSAPSVPPASISPRPASAAVPATPGTDAMIAELVAEGPASPVG